MLSVASFKSAFVFSINSLILSGFPVTSFRLAEASLSAFLWLYTLVCEVFQKYHKMSFIYNYSHFGFSFCNQTILFSQLENLSNLWTTTASYITCEQAKWKQKYLAHKQCNNIIRMASLSGVKVKRKISCKYLSPSQKWTQIY